MKEAMSVFQRIWCRTVQAGFRLAIPFMPYRTPKKLADSAAIAKLAEAKKKRRAFIVTDKGVAEHGLLSGILSALKEKEIGFEIFDETPANPTVKAIEEAFLRYREKRCDFLIAVGGGSPIDCAKGIAARIIKPKKSLWRMRGILKVVGFQPLFIAVPTTAGTGSEATVAAVVTDGDKRRKFTILSFCLAPKYILLDPALTKSLPPAPTAETGLDALTHAVEAYIGRSTTRKTRRYAVHAVSLIKENLLTAYHDGENLTARANMQCAAHEAGLAFTVSYVGYVHAIAHSLGGAYNYPHGRTNATLLPIILRAYGDSCRKKLARLSRKSGISANQTDDSHAAEEFIGWIEAINDETGIPKSLEIAEKDIPDLAKNAALEANPLYPVPKLLSAKALENLYRLARTKHTHSSAELLSLQKDYFASSATLPLSNRIRNLRKLKQAIKTFEPEIHVALYADLGKSGMESYMCETGMARSEITFLLKHLKKFAKESRVRTPLAQFPSRSYTKPSPYGNVLIMSPWNYPFMLTIEPLADALAAGNTVIVKPSAYSPNTSQVIQKILSSTFPPELVSTILGGRQQNKELLDLPFDKIFFTGSAAVGKEVMRRASEHLTPVTLELGGKSPCIVDKTANIKLAAKRIVFGKYLNCGQTCVAPDYIYVHRSVEKQLLAELKKEIQKQFGKDPLHNPDYGKIINEKHFQRILSLIDANKLYYGGKTDENALKIEPTVLQNVTREDAVMQEEIFGPVLPVLSYSEEETIIDEINKGAAPLATYLFTSDKALIKKITARVRFGGGCINDVVIHLATSNMGFGGFRESGMGAYHGKDGFECFSHRKSIVNKKTWLDLPMRYQPYRNLYDKLIHMFLK